MKKITIVIVLIFSIFISNAENKTSISGEIENNTQFTQVSLENIFSGEILSTSKITDGKYMLEAEIEKSNYFKITFSKEIFILYIPEPGEKAIINIDINKIKDPEIINSKQTSIYYVNNIKYTNLSNTQEKTSLIKSVIDENPKSLACLLFIDVLDIGEDFAYYKKLSDGLAQYSDNAYVSGFIQRVKNEAQLAVGSKSPEIALTNQNGEIVKLSSLQGKYVLIDFWAAWCRPCRMESPNMVKMYGKYNSKGFEIYSVSLDQTKADWIQAIEDDKLGDWTHVSDLKGWNSEGGKTYNVHSIPFTVLLDKDGKIIAKGLRGKSLEDKLAEIFGE